MMKILGVIVFMLGIYSASFAQSHKLGDTRAPEKRAATTVDQLVERIMLLNDNQKDSLFIILKFYYDDLITYRKSKRDDLIPVIVKIRDEKVAKLLSEGQYKEYAKFMEEARLAEQRRSVKTQKYGNRSM